MQDCKHNIGNVCSINVLAEDWKKNMNIKKMKYTLIINVANAVNSFYSYLFFDLNTVYSE